jgi:hypothetical protein
LSTSQPYFIALTKSELAKAQRQPLCARDFAVVKAFSELVKEYPYKAVRVAHVLLQEDGDGWSIHGWSQHLDSILETALKA